MKKLAIIGSGELSDQIIDQVEQSNDYEIIGLIDNVDTGNTKYPIIGTDDDIEDLYKSGKVDCFFIGIGYAHFNVRKKIYERFKGLIPFANIIHPTAFINSTVKMGEGVFVGVKAIVNYQSQIGNNIIILAGVHIGNYDVICDHTYIAVCAVLAGKVNVGECCFLGVNSTFRDGVSIAANSTIGCGATVTKNLEEPGVYVGSPAKLLDKK